MKEKLKGNIWKLFVAEVTQREYYFPVLSIYFLTIPNATAQQIGLWTGIGYLAEFLFEVPSGYISDRIGHKKMLIVGKVAMICAALSFIHGGSLLFFVLGAIFTALSFAAQSGTHTAFLHETLVSTGQEKTLARTASSIFANARLISMFFLIIIPLGAQLTLQTPLYLGLMLDLMGLIAVISLTNPSVVEKTTLKKSVLRVMSELRGSGFYPIIIFTSAITGFSIAQMSYIYPYLETLGFPVAFLGVVAGLRSLGQFLIGKRIAKFESRVNIRRVFLFDLILFSSSFALIALLNNIYVIATILVLVGSYEVGRSAFINGYLGTHYAKDKHYMATTLSLKGQASMFFNSAVAYGIGFIMSRSFEAGFYTMSGMLLVILLVTYPFLEKRSPFTGP